VTSVGASLGSPGDAQLEACAAQLRQSGVLGRSGALSQLFDVLVERSVRAEAPACEADLFLALFGNSSRYDPLDSNIRVSVHRLRRKLDAYYADGGAHATRRLWIPKGEYRLAVTDQRPATSTRAYPWRWVAIAASGALLLCLVALLGLYMTTRSPWESARRDPLWAPVLSNGRPIRILVSDYYLFGEAPDGYEARRLVRDFAINSPRDLSEYLATHPEDRARYIDLDLNYVPASGAVALQRLLPLLSKAAPVQTSLTSTLSADMLKGDNIVYVGFLSGLGMLRDPLFSASRFRIGDTYDEIVDRVSGKRYFSEAGGPVAPEATNTDFAYLASFPGPTGGRVVIVAGTRDIGVMQMADLASRPEALAALRRKVGRSQDFEALYAVDGVGRVNVRGRLITAVPLRSDRMWAAGATGEVFPDR